MENTHEISEKDIAWKKEIEAKQDVDIFLCGQTSDLSENDKQIIQDLAVELENGTARRVYPRPSFQPPESCPECLAGVPFDANHRHVKNALK